MEVEAEHSPAVDCSAAHHPTAAAVAASEEADPTADAVGVVEAAERRIVDVQGERWGCIGCGLRGCSLMRTETIEVGERRIAMVAVGSFLGGAVGVGCSRRWRVGRRTVEVT